MWFKTNGESTNENKRINMNKGKITSSCKDHIYLSYDDDFYTKAVLVQIGCSDHNIVVIARIKYKIPKAKQSIVYKMSYRRFSQDGFLSDWWSDIYDEEPPDCVLKLFL